MIACFEIPLLVNISKRISSVASLVLEASEGDKDGEFGGKYQILHFVHSSAMEVAHWA